MSRLKMGIAWLSLLASLVRLSACDELIKTFQSPPTDALFLWTKPAAETTTKLFLSELSELLIVHDSTHRSLRSTILLI